MTWLCLPRVVPPPVNRIPVPAVPSPVIPLPHANSVTDSWTGHCGMDGVTQGRQSQPYSTPSEPCRRPPSYICTVHFLPLFSPKSQCAHNQYYVQPHGTCTACILQCPDFLILISNRRTISLADCKAVLAICICTCSYWASTNMFLLAIESTTPYLANFQSTGKPIQSIAHAPREDIDRTGE